MINPQRELPLFGAFLTHAVILKTPYGWLAGSGAVGLNLPLGGSNRVKTGIAAARGTSSGWRFVVCLLLIAFTLQSYVTQTHIHSATPVAISKIVTHSSGKAPPDGNPVDCPFCQAVAHDGPFHLPTAPLLILSIAFVELVPAALHLDRPSEAFAHIWQSRAPPHR